MCHPLSILLISEDVWIYNIITPHLSLLDIHHLQFTNKWFYQLVSKTNKYSEYKSIISLLRSQLNINFYKNTSIYESFLCFNEEIFELYIETCPDKYKYLKHVLSGRYALYIGSSIIHKFSDKLEQLIEEYPKALSLVFPIYRTQLSKVFKKLFNQEQYVFEYLFNDTIKFSDISEELRNSQPFLLKIIKLFNLKFLNQFDNKFYDDYEIISEAIKREPYTYYLASKRLKDDKNILLGLFSNKQISSTMIRKAVTEMPKEYYSDMDIMSLAIRKDPGSLKYASCYIQDNRDIILSSVKKQPICFTYASNRLKEDREIALEALSNASNTGVQLQGLLAAVSANLLFEREFIMDLLDKDPSFFKYIPSYELIDDREVVLKAIRKNGYLLYYASSEMKNNKEIVSTAVDVDGEALMYASSELKDDKEIVLKAVRNNGKALLEASERLKQDEEVILEALKSNVSYISFASKRFKQDQHLMNHIFTLYPEAKNFLE
ncbi:hypothetical protein ABK040_016738 [Willaertia magna]